MEYEELFRYCPKCGHETLSIDDRHITCSSCTFSWYVSPNACNGVVITNKKHEILLVRRRFDPRKGFWDLPGGFIGFGENAEESLAREIKEELEIELQNIEYLGTFSDRYLYNNTHYHTFGVMFTADYLEDSLPEPHDDISEVAFFPYQKIPYDALAFPSMHHVLELFFTRFLLR